MLIRMKMIIFVTQLIYNIYNLKTTMKNLMTLTISVMIACSANADDGTSFSPPVMGWSSWNTLALNINEENICANADAQVSSGLRDAGYVYCNIDDGYMGGRDSNGDITYNKELFPHGMKYIADYMRSIGLKPGIYNDAAGHTCGSGSFANPSYGQDVGLHGHEAADCSTYFDKWGYDFIKVDYCGASSLNLQEEPTYTAIGNAIKAESEKLGRKISFNICRWAFPGVWARNVADSWRISGDINASWESFKYVIGKNKYLSAYAGGGHYNDMDMLEIGKGLPLNEEQVHMAIWCIQSSPLLVGCDMTTIPEKSLELMKNKELIDIDQDSLGLQAYIVYQKNNVLIYVKDIKELHGNTRAVAILNLGDSQASISLPLSIIDMKGLATTRDLINHEEGPKLYNKIRTSVNAHSVKMWTVTGTRIERTKYNAGTAYMPLFNDLGHDSEIIRYSDDAAASCGVKAGYLGNSPENVMQWRDVYSENGGEYKITIRFASGENRDLKVKINEDTTILFKDLYSGGYSTYSSVSFNCKLKKGDNTVTLGRDDGWAPDIDGIVIENTSAVGINDVKAASDDKSANIYSTDGSLIMRNAKEEKMKENLPKGIYIYKGKKKLVK